MVNWRLGRLGPTNPISVEALRALDATTLILLKTPRDEWEFVLSQAKSKAEESFTLTPGEFKTVIKSGVDRIKQIIKNSTLLKQK